ncbi:hypothetical protein ACERIM_18745 [Natrinema sp. H-ect1]|uniref:hypothetical protein n=1 Tax=Natrinema sp. H-ect1 TaxID=3242700 RepID=UPI00359D08DD
MRRRYGERAVTVQIGAILLLAIVFTALALYQVNAVPAENQAIESEHNQQVHGELQDLRNAVRNVGTGGGTRSVSITLGTSYPARTFLTNPPDPTGTLETTERANVTIANATYEGSADDYDGDPSNLTGRHETTTVAYHPDYNEYRTAPTTRIEHGFAFDEYDDAAVPVTEQGLLENGTIRLVVLEGSLSTTGRNTVSLDPTSVSGPSDEIPIRSDGGNITLTLPTQTPSVWNETIGASFEAGESNARIVGTGPESVRIELADDGDYALQLARVSIDGSGGADPRYDVQRADSDGESTAESGQFDVNWDGDAPTNVTISGDDSVTLGMRATDDAAAVSGASVSYAVSDPDGVVADFDGTGTTDATGRNRTALTLESSAVADDGSPVTVYASSGGAGDRHELTVHRESSGLPDGSVAYHDENGNGEYDVGEPTYAESDLETVDVAGSLVVAEDAFSANGMDITAERLTVADGVRLRTQYGGIQLTTTSGEVTVGGTLDTTDGGGQSVTIDSAGETALSDGTIRSSGEITVDSVGAVVADDATLDATAASYGSITVTGDDSIALRRASVTTQGGISVTGGMSVDAAAAAFESTGVGQEIALESNDDMTLDRVAIDVGPYGTMTGSLNKGRNTLFVDGSEFRRDGYAGTFTYSPNGIDVIGDPAVGSTSK